MIPGSRVAADPEECGLTGWLMVDGQRLLQIDAGEKLLTFFAVAGRSAPGSAALRAALARGASVVPDEIASLAGCGPAVLQAAWLSLVTAEQQAELRRFEPLLARVGEPGALMPIRWPLLKEDMRSDRRGAGLAFLLKGSAAACIEIACAPRVEGLSAAEGEALVVLSLAGDVAGEAGAKRPVNLGLASASATARGDTKLSFVTPHARETMLAEAVVSSVRAMGSPFSLEDVSAFLRAHPRGAVMLTGNGELRLAMNVALSAATGPAVPGTGSVKIDARASWNGAYATRLTLADPADPSHVQMEVKRSESAQASLGVAARLDVDASALSRQLKGVLAAARGAHHGVAALMAKLDPFFQPGTLLKTRVSSLVKEWSVDPALKPVLLALAGLGVDGEPGDVLEKQLERQLNLHAKLWEQSSREVALDVMRALQEAGGHSVLAGNVAQRFSSDLQVLLNALQAELLSEVRRLVTENAVYQEAVDALNALDFGLAGRCQTIDERANEIVGPVRKMLCGFQASVAGLVRKVETYLTSRLAVQFGFGAARSVSDGLVLKAIFDAGSAQAPALFSRLFSDDLAGSLEALRGCSQAVEVIEGQFTRVLSRSSYSAGSLSFADILLDTKAVLKAQATFTIDQAGSISAIVEGGIDKEQSGLGEAECVSFGNRVELQSQRTSANASVSLRITKTDTSLRREELRAFVAPLAGAGLLGITAEPLALANWEMWKPAGARGIACRLGLECRLSSEEILTLLQLTRGAGGVVDGASALDVERIRRAAAEAIALEVFGQGSGEVLRRKIDLLLLRLARQVQGVPGELAGGIAFVAGLSRPLEREINRHVWESLPSEAQAGAQPLQWAGDLVRGLCVALEKMRRLVVLKPVGGDVAGPGEITQAQALTCEHEMLKALSPWVQTEGLSFRDLLGSADRSDIAEVTLALLRTVQALATQGRRFRDVRATMERLDSVGVKPLSPPVVVGLG